MVVFANIQNLHKHFHTVYLEYTNIAHGVYFPAIEQFNTASAFVEIVPRWHCIAIMLYLTVAFP